MFVLNPACILSGRTACFVLTFLSQFIIDHMYPQSLPGGHFSALQYHRWLFWTNTRDIVTNKAWTSKCSLWRRWKDWRSGRVVNLKAWDFRHFWFQVTQERWGRGRGSGKEREDREIRLEGVPVLFKLQSSPFYLRRKQRMSSSFLTGSLADLSSLSSVFYITVFHKSASSGIFSLISYGKPPFWMFWAAREAGSTSLPCQASFCVRHTLQVPSVFNLPAHLIPTELRERPDFPESLGLCSCDFLH